MATETGYNGWTNYETWVVKLWIDNEQWSQEAWLGNARMCLESDRPLAYESQTRLQAATYDLAQMLKDEHEEVFNERMGLGHSASVFTDLMSHALARVEWREIAESLIDDAQEVSV